MKVIDSHTEGEPTRVIIEGAPDLGNGPFSERVQLFRDKFDHIRQSVILEPRGSDILVGALLCPPTQNECATGVIFFNNTGYLGMCGHGTMGVAATLKHLGFVETGEIQIETPVGIVKVHIESDHKYSVENVPSYLYRSDVSVNVDSYGQITGDIAWGGNWFFLTHDIEVDLEIDQVELLTEITLKIKDALVKNQITGLNGAEIDHIELFSSPNNTNANSKNFVLCPGNAYDRSPCGTGTSAKIACLATKKSLNPGEQWVQESIINSSFMASYRYNEKSEIIPTISGRAFICGETTLIMQAQDPFKYGIV